MYGHFIIGSLLFNFSIRVIFEKKENLKFPFLTRDTSTIGENRVEQDVTRFMKFLTLETRDLSHFKRAIRMRIHWKTARARSWTMPSIIIFPFHRVKINFLAGNVNWPCPVSNSIWISSKRERELKIYINRLCDTFIFDTWKIQKSTGMTPGMTVDFFTVKFDQFDERQHFCAIIARNLKPELSRNDISYITR